MFFGEFTHSLDTKGRVIIPSKFREELGEMFYITQGFDGCLYIFSKEQWEKTMESFSRLPMSNKNARKILRQFTARAAELEPDKMGRVLIPKVLRDVADLNKEVVITGTLNRLEVWSKERWEDDGTMDPEKLNECSKELEEAGIEF